MTGKEVYAKVDASGNIIEYPIYANHIKNRGQSPSLYSLCKHLAKPSLSDEFTRYKETMTTKPDNSISGYTVEISYSIEPKPLNQILIELYIGKPPTENISKANLIANGKAATYEKIKILIDQLVTYRLNQFALSRGYNTIEKLIAFKYSNNPTFANEAIRGILMQDLAWDAYIAYIAKLDSGELPIPRNVREVIKQIPAFTWE